MARIMRSTSPETTPPLVPSPRRMGRVSRPSKDGEKKAALEAMIANHLQLVAINQEKIDYLKARIQPEITQIEAEIARLKTVLEGEIKEAKIDGYTNGVWEARFITTMGRMSREIDTVKVRKALKEEDFLKVVKVQVTELRTYMSEREIDGVSNITPAAPGETKFVVQPVVHTKSKKGKA